MDTSKFLSILYKDTDNSPASDIQYPDATLTPSSSLNWALNGGIRRGGFYCFSGPPSGGKSFMTMACISEMLKHDKTAVVIWFDAEWSFSSHFAKVFLPNLEDRDRILVRRSQPPTGSSIFDWYCDTLLGMVKDGLNVIAVVIDSINAIIAPKEGNAKSTEDHIMGDLSAYLPKALRKILSPSKPRLYDNFLGISVFFVSQVRDNLSPDAIYTHIKYITPGGKAFKHFIDADIQFEEIQSKKSKIFDESIMNMNSNAVETGHRCRAKIIKHKYGPPNRVAEFNIDYNKGVVDQEEEAAQLAINLGILKKEGNTYFLEDQKIAVGETAVIEAIVNDNDLYQKILEKVKLL